MKSQSSQTQELSSTNKNLKTLFKKTAQIIRTKIQSDRSLNPQSYVSENLTYCIEQHITAYTEQGIVKTSAL